MFGPAAAAVATFLCLLTALPHTAAAQDSRAELLARQRAEKAARVQPYEAGRLERFLLFVERTNPFGRLAPRNGFYIEYGYSDKPTGSGIALGVGYRHDLFDRHARLDVEAGMSIRTYRLLRADFSLPYLLDERLELGISAEDRHHPHEDFWGIGSESLEEDRVSFLHDTREYKGRAIARPVSWLQVGAEAGLVKPSVGPGEDDAYPSIEERFTPAQAPGLAFQPDFGFGGGYLIADTRDHDGNPRAGGYHAIRWRRFLARDGVDVGFRMLQVDLQRFFPIFDKKRVIALRGRAVSVSPDAGQEVPFYAQPTLGGSDSLRSYGEFRFRDRHIMFLNAEYRWEAFSGLDMALFSDWGKVAPRASDLKLSGLKHAYGVGFRFNTYKAVFLRFDVAAGGDEGIRYFLKFSNVF